MIPFDKITKLMQVFDLWESSFREARRQGKIAEWRPQGTDEINAFEALIALENRAELKAWYSMYPSLNAGAESFRQVLERSIGEPLPIKK
jgi:hypothetical protein